MATGNMQKHNELSKLWSFSRNSARSGPNHIQKCISIKIQRACMHIICQMKAKTTRNTQKIHQKSPRQPIYTKKRQTHRTATSHTTQRRNVPQKGNLGSIQGHPTLRFSQPKLRTKRNQEENRAGGEEEEKGWRGFEGGEIGKEKRGLSFFFLEVEGRGLSFSF